MHLLFVFDYLSTFPEVLDKYDFLVDLNVKLIFRVTFLLKFVNILPSDLF